MNEQCICNGEIMQLCIEYCFDKNDINTYTSLNEICLKCVTDFYDNNKDKLLHEVEKENANVLLFLGCRYQSIHDYDNMKICYIKSIEKGNIFAMYNLGHYYNVIEKNDDLMIKYYLMAVEKDNKHETYYVETLFNLGVHYQSIGNNDLMIKYYEMAVDEGDTNAMVNLGTYYGTIDDYIKMEKLFLMFMNKININDNEHNDQTIGHIAFSLATYYGYLNEANELNDDYLSEENELYNKMINYYSIGTKVNHIESLEMLCSFINIIKIYLLNDNKEFIINNISNHVRDSLNNSLKNITTELCQSCFTEKLCCLKNDIYLCGLCY